MTDKIIKSSPWDPEPIDLLAIDPAEFGPVLKPEVLDAIDRGREIIARARDEAARIRKRAKDLLATVAVEKAEEKKRGFAEGHEEGLAQWTQRVLELEAEHEAVLKEAEPTVVRMIIDSVEKILGREIEGGAVADVVRQAIAKAVGRKLSVHVNPGDFLTVQERLKELTGQLDSTQALVLKEDDSVTPGGCLVETELGTVDARLEVQLAAIRRALGVEEG